MPHEFSLDKATGTASAPAAVVSAPTGDTKPAEQKPSPAVEPAKKTEVAAPQAAAEDPNKKPAEVTPTETGDDDDLEAPDPSRPWTYTAVKQEREKRRKAMEAMRAMERELAEMRGRMVALEQHGKPTSQQKQPTPEELEQAYFSNPREWTEKRVEQALEAVRNERYQERLAESRERARERHKDYDEVVSEFFQYLQQMPSQQADALSNAIMREQRDPAGYVYNQVKIAREARKHGGSVEAYMAKVESETRARVEAEMKQKAAVAAAESVPKTMTGGGGPGLSAPGGSAPAQTQWEKHWSSKKF